MGGLGRVDLGAGRARGAVSELDARLRVAWTREQLETAAPGEWLVEPPAGWSASGLTMWLPELEPGALLLATDSEAVAHFEGRKRLPTTFDNYARLDRAAELGAAGTITDRVVDGPPGIPMYLVDDSLAAMAALGRVARGRYRGQVVAVTGSVGKSTVVSMLRHVLRRHGHVVSTRGNRNMPAQIPMYLAATAPDDEFCVIEMSHPTLREGSDSSSLLVRPHTAIITQIAIGSVASLPSLSDTARIKGRIFTGLEVGGAALINRRTLGFELARGSAIRFGHRSPISYGNHPEADVRPSRVDFEPEGTRFVADVLGRRVDMRIAVPGPGMLDNAVGVLAACATLGIDPRAASDELSEYRAERRRLERRHLTLPTGGTVEIIDDTHNATIASMAEALNVLRLAEPGPGGRRVAVLGRVIRLGKRSRELHRALADDVVRSGAALVFTHGDDLLGLRERLEPVLVASHHTRAAPLAADVLAALKPGDVVLVKGSRKKADFYETPKFLFRLAARQRERTWR